KLFRKLDEGDNPEEEMLRRLTENGFTHAPKLLGTLEYRRGMERIVLGLMEEYIHCEAGAMAYFSDQFQIFIERAMTDQVPGAPRGGVIELDGELPKKVRELFGTPLQYARLLGGRAGDLHMSLASAEFGEFVPEPFTDFYRQSIYHGFLGTLGRTMEFLRGHLDHVPENLRGPAEQLLGAEGQLRSVLRPLRETRVHSTRIRLHGDLHLDQVLFTGKDFVFIDFEGDPSRPASERRIKSSPARDLAAMVWSFYYSSHAPFHRHAAGATAMMESAANRERVQAWAELWAHWMGTEFLRSYRACTKNSRLLPPEGPELSLLLNCYLIDRACKELNFNLVQSSGWMSIPIEGLLRMVRGGGVGA
ncbi:MAG: hypothetical protein ABI383_01840, partial [Acidobacteriaceae bacterium]